MRVSVSRLQQMKLSGEKISMVTAYDASMTRLVERAGLEIILIGDSLGHVIQGHENTLAVSLDEMIYHCRCVSRVSESCFLVGDMSFGSYQGSLELGMQSCMRVMKEGGVHAVKIEGGAHYCELVRQLKVAGVPVMGHLGLTPQSIHQLGGYKVQGRGEAGEKILEDALALQEAGAFSLVLECVPESLGRRVSETLNIPVIGIGAGAGCDGQVLVYHDLLGLNMGKMAKFVKRYASLGEDSVKALEQYRDEVRGGVYPSEAYLYHG